MIKAERVSKDYNGKTVVHGVSFQVNKGEIFGLLGPNGAGKSTILGIMATVLKPSGGDILIDGLSVKKDKSKVRKMISYVPQRVALHMTLTVGDNLKFWSKMASVKISPGRIDEIAGVIGLKERMNDRVEQLSEGMKRRLNIGVALLHDPAVLIMDEPTLGVDIKSKKEIVDFINTLAGWGKTIVYTSHDIREIQQLCRRVALLNEGKIMFMGTLKEAEQEARKKGLTGPSSAEKTGDDLESVLSALGRWWS